MATNSIHKDVYIKDKYLAQSLITALELAENRKTKKVVLKKKAWEVPRNKTKTFFKA